MIKILDKIKKKQYSIFQQQNILYCYKGIIGRISPIFVHFSIVLVLIGTISGSLFGFKAQEVVPKTEIFQIQNLLNIGSFTNIPQLYGRINDFWISYTKQKTILQFYSDLSLLNNQGVEIERRTISVNSPLIMKGIYMYQT